MDDKELLDIYTDYLVSLFRLTIGTGLLRLLDDVALAIIKFNTFYQGKQRIVKIFGL